LTPNDASSTFAATITRDPGTGFVTLTWPSQLNLEFDVLWTDDLSESQPWSFNAGPVTDTVGTGTLSFTDSGTISESFGYYQVRLK
jgi:hypothetical protein